MCFTQVHYFVIIYDEKCTINKIPWKFFTHKFWILKTFSIFWKVSRYSMLLKKYWNFLDTLCKVSRLSGKFSDSLIIFQKRWKLSDTGEFLDELENLQRYWTFQDIWNFFRRIESFLTLLNCIYSKNLSELWKVCRYSGNIWFCCLYPWTGSLGAWNAETSRLEAAHFHNLTYQLMFYGIS